MKKIIKQASDGVSFLELLLDENLCAETVWIEKGLLICAGGKNTYLKAKQKYELLIRVAKIMPVKFVEMEEEPQKEYVMLEDEIDPCADTGWYTDCYVVGKYSSELRAHGVFDAVVEALLKEAAAAGRQQETLVYLEQMIRQDPAYHRVDEGSRPILLYKGDDVCHNVLNVFAEQFGAGLEHAGKPVIYFDCAAEGLEILTTYMHQHFQAVIGVQSYLFSVKMKDEIHYLHEYIYGPKYNFIFDHPIWMRHHLQHRYTDFYVLTHDENYVSFLKRYFGCEALCFPPGGMSLQEPEEMERVYDLTFVGTYGNYWSEVLLIHGLERGKRFVANKFLLKMRQQPDLTAEEALTEVIGERGLLLTDGQFVELFYELRRVIYCVMHYYRDRVLRSILESGIRLDVFGDSWAGCPLRRYPNLTCHPDVTVEESLEIWKQSKLSLNIMSWHKGGFTERMIHIMLAGAVLVTDGTTYLEGRFDGMDIVSYRLEERQMLPRRIKQLLADENLRTRIASNGRNKALAGHTWEKRAKQFLEILQGRAEQ